ncbi:MAG: response regulator [Okeania sp. SIO2C9]|uniref:hybrid sensor histidine kinase/response regulator n=1 Tax=Okeania sp. SIO2C9 TaxID=2607791 RepID=UPI0013BFB093|nr:hybrid sensor histidine kinase/response regulator [Okeania sp. SIO2C9]NEQ71978.1 response regulator [Okeania sp. SIO2C9]
MNQKKEHTIMVVDNEYRNAKLMLNFLKFSGFNVIVLENGETAIEKVKNVLPDLILLDILMPGIDGFEVCRYLQASERTKNIPIIFMTSLSESTEKIKGLNLGAVDYIVKPFKPEELLSRINIHIRLQKEIKERKAAEIALQKSASDLEDKIQARTAELSQSLEELKEAQLQLIQSEKMSNIGALVAGIAHELNNPVSIVVGNVKLAETYLTAIINHIKLYQKQFPDPGLIIEKDAEEMDIDFLIEELPKILFSIKKSSDRISEISVSLRSFARADSTSKVAFDINEGIDNTLTILQHRLKANHQRPAIEIIKNYGNLPQINCYPNTLNQVFMNLLVNAIDSLEEYNYKKFKTYQEILQNPNRITITTSIIESYGVEIRIANNGLGILENLKDKLYEAFEKTKTNSKISNLGLSMSHLIIVNKHGGKFECNSLYEKGTEFVIKLPNKKRSQKSK